MSFVESVISIGSPTPLHGLVSTPTSGDCRTPTLVLLNAGLLHHVGSCLLSVRLARNAASVGMRAIRVDFSGIGDSAARAATADHEQRSIDETCEILEYAQQQWGAQEFVLSGLCSASHTGFGAALLDKRVVGIAGIAPFGYRTKKWYLNNYRGRLLSSKRWANLARKLSGRRQAEPESYAAEFVESSDIVGWQAPPMEELQADYQTLLQRGVRFHYTFTGGESSYYNYQGQMLDMYPDLDFGDALREHYLPQARHIMTEPIYQQHVLRDTQEWIDANWP